MSGPLDQSLFCAGSICGVSLSTLPRAAFNKGLEQASCLGSSPLSCSCVAHAVEQHILHINVTDYMACSTEDPTLHSLVIECPSLSESCGASGDLGIS